MELETEAIVERIDSEEEDLESSAPVYRIRSYPSDPDLETLYGRWQRGEIVIPAFQRGFVWKPTQASRLIESFLLGLPIPPVFVFLELDEEKQLVIDGQQRLTSIFAFFEGKLPDGQDFYLRGVAPEWEGKSFTSLHPVDRARLFHSILRVNIIEPSSSDDKASISEIFERLNTGGTALTPQEIRNCTFQGPFNDMLVEVNKDSVWRDLFGAPIPDPRMRDVELIVRFLALLEDSESYTKPMKGFLNTYMRKHQNDPNPASYRDKFLKCVGQVAESLEERPFHLRRGINVAAFDATMVAFATSERIPPNIAQRYQALKEDPAFFAATTAGTTDVDTVQTRLRLAKSILFG